MLKMLLELKLKLLKRTESLSLKAILTKDFWSWTTIQAQTLVRLFHMKMRILFRFFKTHQRMIKDTKICCQARSLS